MSFIGGDLSVDINVLLFNQMHMCLWNVALFSELLQNLILFNRRKYKIDIILVVFPQDRIGGDRDFQDNKERFPAADTFYKSQ